jgi:hypothetical protein
MSGLAFVHWWAATAVPMKHPEIGLRRGVSLVCGELIEACGLAVVLGQIATAVRVENPKVLRGRVSLVGGDLELVSGELEEAASLAVVLRQTATAVPITPRRFAGLRRALDLCGRPQASKFRVRLYHAEFSHRLDPKLPLAWGEGPIKSLSEHANSTTRTTD